MKGAVLLPGDDSENHCPTHTRPRSGGKAVEQGVRIDSTKYTA